MSDSSDKNQNHLNNTSHTGLDLRAIGIFQKDNKNIFVLKKTERLVSALYLLTSFLSDSEPVRLRIRDAATRLVSYSVNLSKQRQQEHSEAVNGFVSSSIEILSLLEAANISEIISSMNYEILKSEIENIIDFVDLKEKNLSAKFLLTKDFFEMGKEYFDIGTKQDETNIFLKNRGNFISNDLTQNKIAKGGLYKGQNKGQNLIKDTENEEKKRMSFNKGHIAIDKNNRQEIIMSLLKNTKEISVKDVSTIVADCSEKTIQRELLNLVARGVLKKEGERRWSRYSLS